MQRKLWLALAFTGLLSVGCRPDAEAGNCGDGVDNDEDGLIDCADAVDCSNEPSCKQEICDNGVDDDGNGASDCADAACAANPACVESNCGDGIDNDNDTDIDCDDIDCAANALCQTPAEICNNNIDDDLDGDADCADTDCAAAANCQGPEDCENDIDDDADGDVDCADSECAANLGCAVEAGNCADGLDNDGDTFIDCDDFDCDNDPLCPAEICDDGQDNDGDSFIDCNDFDCTNDPACGGGGVEICNDGQDNDGDSFIDCNDFDCTNDPACGGGGVEICNDGQDNDGDTFIDCNDFDCDNDPACVVVAGVHKIQEIQDGTVTTGNVTINDVYVTALKGAVGAGTVTFYVQEPQDQTIAGHAYPEFAGVAVFIRAGDNVNALPVIGDCVSLTGPISEFQSLTEIGSNQAAPTFTINAQAGCTARGAFPTPFALPANGTTFADIAQGSSAGTAGPKAENFEGVLVKLNSVQVTTAPDNFAEFSVAEQSNVAGPVVNIDDFFVVTASAIGQSFTSITGIFTQFVNYKVQPRSAADVQ